MVTEKEKALELALIQIERQVGKGSIMKLGEAGQRLAIETIPTGSLSLDMALGVGGLPRGRVTEIFGAESAGKSTLAQHIMAEAQKAGGTAAYIDAENALDPAYAGQLGVDIDTLLVSQPDTAEQALEIAEYLVRSGAVDVVVVDSVAALVPRAELEGDMGDSHMGLQARLMSQALRKLSAAINRSHAVVIFINQLREKIGVVFGNPEVTPGGRALKFYSSVRIDLRRVDSIKHGNAGSGHQGQGQDREEQGGSPVPGRRVRYHVQPGHQQGRRYPGLGYYGGNNYKGRLLLLLRQGPPGPGQGGRQRVPQRPHGGVRGGGGADQGLRNPTPHGGSGRGRDGLASLPASARADHNG